MCAFIVPRICGALALLSCVSFGPHEPLAELRLVRCINSNRERIWVSASLPHAVASSRSSFINEDPMLVARAALLLCILPAVHAFRCAVGHSRPWHAPLDAVMRASYAEGPFKVPDPPANFDGAQWAPHVFKPFPIHVADVRPAAEEIKEVLKEEAAAAAPVAEAAPPAEAPAPVRLPAPCAAPLLVNFLAS